MPPPAQRARLHRVVCACLSALPAPPSAAAELRCIGADEWPAFLDYAASHGVLAVLAPAIETQDLPQDVRARMAQRLLVQSMWAQHLAQALVAALRTMGDAGIAACVLKGPALASRYYRDLGERPSIDLDLLVRPDDLARARAALVVAGYTGDTDLDLHYLLRHSHHVHFTKADSPELELHFQSYQGFGVIVPASAVLDRARPFVLDGMPMLVPSPEDELIYLSVHAAGHSFIRLLWLYDLKQLIAREPVDWAVVRERSEALGVSLAVAYALRLAEAWMGVRGIGQRALAARAWPRTALADRLLPIVAAPSVPSAADNLGGLLFTSLLCDRALSGAALASHHISRTLKHRAHRAVPRLVPESWSA